MSKDSNHIDAFRKYLKGELSEKEAHVFEKESLEDPFLEEALDGALGFKESFDRDLKLLEGRISKKKQNILWLRIAASFLVLTSASFIVWFASSNSQEDAEITMKEESIEDAFHVTEIPTDPEIFPKEENARTKVSEPSIAASKKEPNLEKSQKIKEYSNKKLANESIKKEIPRDETSIQLTNGIKLAQVQVEKNSSLRSSNTFSAPKAARMSSIPTETEGLSMDVEVSEEIVLEEVVFEERPVEDDILFNTEPIIGWDSYHQYLLDSLKYPNKAKRKGIEGRVFIQATIDPNGNLQDLEVVKGIGAGCDKEAIRLIKEGASFKADSLGRFGKVVIPVTFQLD